jgi:hypothetical protein
VCCLQLVVKILRNAYMPLPLSCSRPLQQLVGMLLRADPDDRPTTADLLATSLVRKHLQLLLGLAQGVHRAPASPALALAEAEQAIAAGGSRSATPEAGKRAAAAGAAAEGAADSRAAPNPALASLQLSEQQEDEDVPAEEVQLGGGLSLALRDMMLAVKRMAKVPLHAGGSSGSSSPPQRRRAAAAATAACAGADGGAAAFDGSANSNSRSGEQPSNGSSSPACGDRQATGSRGSTRTRQGSEKQQQPTAGGSSSDALEAEPAAARSATAYAALPTPVAVPATKRPSLHAWDASAAYEVQQKKRAEARYQARIMEQRMAREQVGLGVFGSSWGHAACVRVLAEFVEDALVAACETAVFGTPAVWNEL